MTRAWDVVAYTFQADIHCPKCIGRMFGPTFGKPTEDVLTMRARKLGVDRMDERTFDSGDFPKIIFSSDANNGGHEHCGTCRDCIAHDLDDHVCGHSWVAGMMIVHPEDLAEVAMMRDVECEYCDRVPIAGEDYWR